MVIAHKLDEGRCVRLPIFGETFKILEDRVQARRGEDGHCVFGVLVEISVEDAHILEVIVTFDLEEIPAQIVQLEHRKAIRLSRDRLLDISRILVEVRFATRNDLRDDREAVAGRGLREDRTIAALLDLVLEVSAFRDRHRRGFRPVVLFGCV